MKNENQFLELMKKNGCNEIHIQTDEKSGCVFIIAMNTQYADKGNGGTRMMKYPSFIAGIEDATKLVDVMTKKSIIIGKKYNGGYSGGKGVIIGDLKTQKTPDMLRRYGKFVQSLNGRFQTGTDMNINLKDIEYMDEESDFIDGLASGLGDTATPTAYGVYIAMKVMCEFKYGSNDLKDKIIAVQGVGSVGEHLIKLLVEDGAQLIITDTDPKTLAKVKSKYNVKIVNPGDIYEVECDIFSPNARGGIITDDVIKKLRCDMIVGSANNPLVNGLKTVLKLKRKKIIYAPDYVINIGGVLLSMSEVQGKDFDYVIKKTKEIIETRLRQIIENAYLNNVTLYEAAEALVDSEKSPT